MIPNTEEIVKKIGKRAWIKSRELARVLRVEDVEFDDFVETLMGLQARGDIVRVPGRGWNIPDRV